MRYILTILLLLISSLAQAAVIKTIHAEWEYVGTADAFRVYKSGALVCESFDTVNLVVDCPNVSLDIGDNVFTMTAVGPDGETPHSAPVTLVYAPDGVTIKSIRIVE